MIGLRLGITLTTSCIRITSGHPFEILISKTQGRDPSPVFPIRHDAGSIISCIALPRVGSVYRTT
jgi:hypothetical protein